MGNKKMLLSVIALAASVLLFIGATFAWFIVQITVDVDPITSTVVNIDAAAGLEVSPDGVEYDTTTVVTTQNRVPGDTVFYRLQIDNTGEEDVNIRVRFFGFITGVASEGKSNENYLAGRTLVDAILISATNDRNAEVIANQRMSDLIGTLPIGVTYEEATLIVFSDIFLPQGESLVILFSFTIDEMIGNDYQNLNLSVDSIIVDAIQD